MLRVNCDAVLQFCHHVGRAVIERGEGHIVRLSSLVSSQGAATAANYAATKAYVQTLAEGFTLEMLSHGVSVQSVATGPISSGFAKRAGMTMGQAGTPDDVARAVIAGLGQSGTIRPGLLSKFLGYSPAFLPRPIRIHIMSKIMAGMAQQPN